METELTTEQLAHEASIRVIADCFFAPEPVLQLVATDGMNGWGSFRRGCARCAIELIEENIAQADLTPKEQKKFLKILHNLQPKKTVIGVQTPEE